MSAPAAANIVAIVLRTLGVNSAHMPRSWMFSAEGVVQSAMDGAREEERARVVAVDTAARAYVAARAASLASPDADTLAALIAATDALVAAVGAS